MEFSYEHAPFSTADSGFCHLNLGHGPTPKYLKECPAKRARESEDQDQVALLDASGPSSYRVPTGSSQEDFALQDGQLIHDHFKPPIQASSQDQVARLDALSYQLASGRAMQGNGGPDSDYDYSQFFVQANSQDHVNQPNASRFRSPIGSAPEASASQYSTLTNALSSVTPTQSQDSNDQVDAQPDEATAPILHGCPVCRGTGTFRGFRRVQERNRHVETHLPHSILCPFQCCTWTGRRQWDFKEHWRRKHPGAGQAPGGDANEIYDPKDFVKSIVGGTPVKEVKRSAFAKVQERLEKLGKVVGVNVLGRKRKVDN